MSRLQEFNVWYLSLEQRERRVLAVGALFAAAMLLYASVLHPFLAGKHTVEARVLQQQVLLEWMRPAAQQLQALRGRQPAALPSGGSLLAMVDKSAGEAGIGGALKQVQTNSDGSVRVQLQGAGFDSLMRWLGRLHQQYGISASQLTAQRSASPGTVDATLTLEPPGA